MSSELRPNLIALNTIIYREVRRFMRIWPQTLLPPVITMVLYFVIFGNLIGRQIGDMGGFTYMEYIVPGLIMMSVITNSYGNVVSSFFGSKFQRSIEELMVSPVSPQLLGYPSRLVDSHTLEVQVDKAMGITALFTQLAAQNIEVLSLRNKTNRLEELFVSLVEKNLAKVAV